MSRQLKFRVYDKLTERFIKCDEGYQGHYVLSLNGEFHNLQNGSGGKEYVVQQWTGLKTRSGKEVYEGDILAECHDGGEGEADIGSVFFAAGTFMIDGDGPLYDHTYSLSPDILEDYEVIGNVFENPKLVKENQSITK
jgi:uncharacterized phage protein (TIGR01671 family)